MIIETKFDMGQRVFVPEFSYQPCRIVVIKLVGRNLFYEVEYWLSDGVKSATLWEDELVHEVPKNETGFCPGIQNDSRIIKKEAAADKAGDDIVPSATMGKVASKKGASV